MKCKNCKTKFTPIQFNIKYCLQNDKCRSECAKEAIKKQKIAKQKAWNKEKKYRKEKLLTVQEYVKTVQKTFNAYIRERDKGKCCISCQNPIKGVRHASHYISAGGHWSVRFNENNVWVSCYKCNVMLSGNQIEYRKQLILKIGLDKVEELEKESGKTKRFTIDELKEINKKYKNKLNEIKWQH